MGLVDYSESSGSEDEAPPKPTTAKPPAPSATRKKTAVFQKVVDRSNTGKIVVNLPSIRPEDPGTADPSSEEPPAKRARRTGGKSGLFSGFNSFLPPPKNAAAKAAAAAPSSVRSGGGGGGASSRPVFQLKTGAEPGFSRERGGGGGEDDDDDDDNNEATSSRTGPIKAAPQPSIPEGMKPADEVKLVGKPMMFKPLSVARKPKKTPAAAAVSAGPKAEPAKFPGRQETASPAPAPAPSKKVSLFSIEPEETQSEPSKISGAYEPLFEAAEDHITSYTNHGANAGSHTAPTTAPTNDSNSLDTIADDLNLSAAMRRELFGRQKKGSGAGAGAAQTTTASRVINFNTDEEYRHNEQLRASGQQQMHNPVRAIAPGKHNLRQLVNQVQNQREALEESFAKGKSNRKEASNRYGW